MNSLCRWIVTVGTLLMVTNSHTINAGIHKNLF